MQVVVIFFLKMYQMTKRLKAAFEEKLKQRRLFIFDWVEWTQCIFIWFIFIFLREASSPCQRDIILLSPPRNLLMILQELQSPISSIQELLQKVTEINEMLSPKKHTAHVEFKVCVWMCACVCGTADVFFLCQARISHKCTASDLSHYSCCRCSKQLCPGGEGEGGMGEGAAQWGRSGSIPLAALGQQRAVGGDYGGGWLQTHRIPWQW